MWWHIEATVDGGVSIDGATCIDWWGYVVSPNIHPPSRNVTTRHSGGLERERVKVYCADVSCSTWVAPVEICH
jgi:hypothetical protein